MLKEDALGHTLWRTHCGRGHGPIVRQATGGDGGDDEVQVHINFVVSSFIFKNHLHRIINTAFSVHHRTMKTFCCKNIV